MHMTDRAPRAHSKASAEAPRNGGYTSKPTYRTRLYDELAGQLSSSELNAIYARRFEP